MADSAYDDACVDAVAAEHVEADCVVGLTVTSQMDGMLKMDVQIHYGPASLTATTQIPAFYVIPQENLDERWIESLKKEIAKCTCEEVWVFLDSSLEHRRQDLTAALYVRESASGDTYGSHCFHCLGQQQYPRRRSSHGHRCR